MRRPAILFGLSGALLIVYVIARLAGMARHTSAIAGMPISSESWVLGPLYVVLYLLIVVVAPVLTIAGTLDTFLLLRRE